MLHPRVLILVRPSGEVQLGWDPEGALLLRPPDLDPAAVLAFLRLLDGLCTRPQLLWRAGECGIEAARAAALLDEIDAAGLLIQPERPAARIRTIRVHGLGPLSDAICTGLRGYGLQPTRSRGYRPGALETAWRADLIVLGDTLMPDPRLVQDLVRLRIPHLPVRIRDDKGVIGPLVLPGATSCLRCTDLIRCEYDSAWPRLAAQLLDRVGHAAPSGIAATAALALRELEVILRCSPRRWPDTWNATLELDLDRYVLRQRPWPRHPACGCHTPVDSRAR